LAEVVVWKCEEMCDEDWVSLEAALVAETADSEAIEPRNLGEQRDAQTGRSGKWPSMRNSPPSMPIKPGFLSTHRWS